MRCSALILLLSCSFGHSVTQVRAQTQWPATPVELSRGPTCASEYLGTVNGQCQYTTVTVKADQCGAPFGFSQQPTDNNGNCPAVQDPPCDCNPQPCRCLFVLVPIPDTSNVGNFSFQEAMVLLDEHVTQLTGLRDNPDVRNVRMVANSVRGPVRPGPSSRLERTTQSLSYAEQVRTWMGNPANGTEAERVQKFNNLYVPALRRVEDDLRVVGMNLNGRVRLKDGQPQANLGTAGSFSVSNPVTNRTFREDKVIRIRTTVAGNPTVLYFQTYLVERNRSTAFLGYQISPPNSLPNVVDAEFQDRHRYAHIVRTFNGRNFLVTSKTDLEVDFATGF